MSDAAVSLNPMTLRVPLRSSRSSALIAIFAGWAALALMLASRHEMWRDEVRALSFAIDPPSLLSMLQALHGEGHPALWYLVLRAGHALTGSMLVLPVAAFVFSALGVGYFLWRAPFDPLIKLLVAGSMFAAVEYTVIARNYGIGMLPIFVFAAKYDAWRGKGIRLGLILLVLANTNIHSTISVLCLLMMWLLETIAENGLRWSKPLKVYLANACIAGVGVIAAVVLTQGPANDAISSSLPVGGIRDALEAIVHPGSPFRALAPSFPGALSVLLFGCLFGLGRHPALLLAGLTGLLLLAVLFTVGYPGYYRHTAVWLLLLISLLWIAELRRIGRGDQGLGFGRLIGRISFVTILTFQVGMTVAIVSSALMRPWSNSKAVAALIKSDPRLANAIVMSEPDLYLEPLRYYGIERTFLLRESRFGRTVNFTRNARLALTLGDVLEEAQRLKRENGAEIVIMLETNIVLDPSAPPRLRNVGYNWTFATTPDQVKSFVAETEFLARFDGSLYDEDYALYRLK